MTLRRNPPPSRLGWYLMGLGVLLLAAATIAIILVVRGHGSSKPAEAKSETPTATATTVVQTAVVDGHVWEANYPHGPAIPNSYVRLVGNFDGKYQAKFATTDKDGHFEFDAVPYGSYDLSVDESADYLPTGTSKSFGVNGATTVDLLPLKKGFARPLGPVGDNINFVRVDGVKDRSGALIVMLLLGKINSEDQVNDIDCNVLVTHHNVAIAYRSGGSLDFYTGALENTPACKVVLKNGDVWYVQRMCGNLLKVPPGQPPIVEKPAPPTATPTSGKEVPSTPTNTPVPGSSPAPSATNVPPTATPPVPTQTPAPTFTPVGKCPCPTPVTPEPTFPFQSVTPVRDPTNTPVPIIPTATQRPSSPTSTPVCVWGC